MRRTRVTVLVAILALTASLALSGFALSDVGAATTTPAGGPSDGAASLSSAAGVPPSTEREPNDRRETATELESGEPVAGTVGGDDDRQDTYAIDVQRGETVTLRSSVPADAPGSAQIVLYDPRGERVSQYWSVDPNETQLIEVTALQTGTYHVEVDDTSEGDGPRRYRLTVATAVTDAFEPNHNFSTARPVAAGERINGTITRADVDWFGPLSVAEGSRLVVGLRATDDEGDGPIVRVADGNGTFVMSGPRSGVNRSVRTVAVAERDCSLYVAVAPTDEDERAGNYTVSFAVERNASLPAGPDVGADTTDCSPGLSRVESMWEIDGGSGGETSPLAAVVFGLLLLGMLAIPAMLALGGVALVLGGTVLLIVGVVVVLRRRRQRNG